VWLSTLRESVEGDCSTPRDSVNMTALYPLQHPELRGALRSNG
jgi:hypothetical protein